MIKPSIGHLTIDKHPRKTVGVVTLSFNAYSNVPVMQGSTTYITLFNI